MCLPWGHVHGCFCKNIMCWSLHVDGSRVRQVFQYGEVIFIRLFSSGRIIVEAALISRPLSLYFSWSKFVRALSCLYFPFFGFHLRPIVEGRLINYGQSR